MFYFVLKIITKNDRIDTYSINGRDINETYPS